MSKDLPLPSMSRHLVATDNLDKVVNETSARTKRDYHRRFLSMYHARIHSNQKKSPSRDGHLYDMLEDLIDEIELKRQNGELKHTSLRQYKSTLNYALTYIVAASDTKEAKRIPPAQAPFYKELASQISVGSVNALSRRVLKWGKEDTTTLKKLDAQALENNRTSSAKMKGFPEPVYDLLLQDRFPGRYWLREFVYFNTKFGLRPKEWQHVQVMTFKEYERRYALADGRSVSGLAMGIAQKHLDGDSIDSAMGTEYTKMPYVMVVKNAKSTHGRACGDSRYIHFKASASEYKRLGLLIDYLNEKAQSSKAVIDTGAVDTYEKRVFEPLQAQLARYLRQGLPKKLLEQIHQKRLAQYGQYVDKQKQLGVAVKIPPPNLKRPTLYSTRHQAIANAKAEGLTALQVAALFGHISMTTAHIHYANKNAGLTGKAALAPNPANIEYILLSLEDSVVQNATRLHDQSHTKEADFNVDPVESYSKGQVVQSTPASVDNMTTDSGKSNTQSAATADKSKSSNNPKPSSDGPGF